MPFIFAKYVTALKAAGHFWYAICFVYAFDDLR